MQYPHTISLLVTAPGVQSANGDWQQGASAPPTQYPCRAEFLRGGGFIKTADGTQSDFNWLVYLPLIDGIIKIGTKVEVSNADGLIIAGNVKRFLKGQFNSRVWL